MTRISLILARQILGLIEGLGMGGVDLFPLLLEKGHVAFVRFQGDALGQQEITGVTPA